MKLPIILPDTPGALKLSPGQAALLFTPEQLKAGEVHGEATHFGPWQIVTAYRALCVSSLTATKTEGEMYPRTVAYAIHGNRTLTGVHQSGYELEGWVSVGGKKRSAFTGSLLFEYFDPSEPDPSKRKKLLSVAVIHARKGFPHET